MSKGLIYIPDISGFTKFVTQTEIEHSRHIVTEVINLILDNNKMGFNVSEIEGDAVLFYKMGKPVGIKKLKKNSIEMFVNFHSYLNEIESRSICQCGACQTASGLSLKFIVHYGEFNEVKINEFVNIMGGDVILAHRLLKNSIPSHEYLLFTDNYIATQANSPKEDLIQNKETIENFGEVVTYYLPLKKLKENLPRKEYVNRIKGIDFRENFSVLIKAPIYKVHQLLVDNKVKLKWTPGIREVRQKEPINRIGTTHTCVINNKELQFESATHKFLKEEAEYIEKGKINGVAFYNYFKLKAEGDNTRLSYSLQKYNAFESGKVSKFAYSVKFNWGKNKILKMMKEGMNAFKKLCEH